MFFYLKNTRQMTCLLPYKEHVAYVTSIDILHTTYMLLLYF